MTLRSSQLARLLLHHYCFHLLLLLLKYYFVCFEFASRVSFLLWFFICLYVVLVLLLSILLLKQHVYKELILWLLLLCFVVVIIVFCHGPLLPGTSPETKAIPTAQASSFRVQIFSTPFVTLLLLLYHNRFHHTSFVVSNIQNGGNLSIASVHTYEITVNNKFTIKTDLSKDSVKNIMTS